MQKTKEIQQELEQYIDPVKREYLPNFFKTGKGQYGEGDKFLGIIVPNTRMVAKRHKDVPFEVMAELLQSEWHECRLCALLMLVERFKKCDEKTDREIFYQDFKKFAINDVTVGVGQVNAMGPEDIEKIKAKEVPFIDTVTGDGAM